MTQGSGMGAIALIAALAASAPSQAAERQDCATYAEVQAVASFVLPSVIDGVASRCRPVLGAHAFFVTSGAAFVKRLRESAVSWETASPAFTKISRIVAGPNLGGEFASGAVVDQLVKTELVDAFKSTDCNDIDSGVAAAATLPFSRLVDFLATGFALIGAPSDLKLCKEP